jgi:hypothetical protein
MALFLFSESANWVTGQVFVSVPASKSTPCSVSLNYTPARSSTVENRMFANPSCLIRKPFWTQSLSAT